MFIFTIAIFVDEEYFFFCLDYSRVNNLLEFVNFQFQKKQKINPKYIYPKNHRANFPIATPAARVSHSTRGSLPAANAEILTVIFWSKNIRAVYRTLLGFIVAVYFILILELLVEICFAVIGFLIY